MANLLLAKVLRVSVLGCKGPGDVQDSRPHFVQTAFAEQPGQRAVLELEI